MAKTLALAFLLRQFKARSFQTMHPDDHRFSELCAVLPVSVTSELQWLGTFASESRVVVFGQVLSHHVQTCRMDLCLLEQKAEHWPCV